MSTPLRQKIQAVQARVEEQHADARRALHGEREFGVEQIRALSESLKEMAPVMERAAELRALEPEIAGQLEAYKAQLRQLQTTLDQLHLMLLTKRAQMLRRGGQLEAVANWAGALRQTQ
jgi:uncharacterized coiled-coil DUF342 family protein